MPKIKIHVVGIPPHKDISRSIRNKNHPHHNRFLELRKAAQKAMRKWKYYMGPVEIKMHYVRHKGDKSIFDYAGGICDTLDGSHGFNFHWLPIVFLDDCQVVKIKMTQEKGERDEYFLEINFL